MSESAVSTNRLLAALPKKAYQQLLPKLERVSLLYQKIIYEPGDIIQHVYFPESGIISLLSAVEEHSTLEVGIVGKEGMAGLPLYLGIKLSNNLAIVQGAGMALRMKRTDFVEECRQEGKLPQVLRRFTHSLMTQIAQSATCNRFHSIESRLARWLLMMRDRIETDNFQITQNFLSNMLGVRREAVNKAAMSFQGRQLITYSRGNLSITNRIDLEVTACRCYVILKKDYENFLD